MKATEEQIRDLLIDEEQRAPLAPDVMPVVWRGIARSKHRRAAAIAATVIGAVAAITIPMALSGTPDSDKLSPSRPVGMTRVLTLKATWLPPGLKETERYGQLRGASVPGDPPVPYAGRAFAGGERDEEVSVADFAGSAAPSTGTTPIRLGHRTGLGWYDGKTKTYQIAVRWRQGHWLEVGTSHFADNKAIALRIAASVVQRPMTLEVSLACSECQSLNVFSVTGTPGDPYILAYGPSLEINVDRHRDRNATTGSLGHGFYAHLTSLPHATRPLSAARLIAIAKTVRMADSPDFSWLGERP